MFRNGLLQDAFRVSWRKVRGIGSRATTRPSPVTRSLPSSVKKPKWAPTWKKTIPGPRLCSINVQTSLSKKPYRQMCVDVPSGSTTSNRPFQNVLDDVRCESPTARSSFGYNSFHGAVTRRVTRLRLARSTAAIRFRSACSLLRSITARSWGLGTETKSRSCMSGHELLGLQTKVKRFTSSSHNGSGGTHDERKPGRNFTYAEDFREHRAAPLALPAVPRAVRRAGPHDCLLRRARPPRRHHVGAGTQGPLVLRLLRQARARLLRAPAHGSAAGDPGAQADLSSRAGRRRAHRRGAGPVSRVSAARLPCRGDL